MVLKKRQKAILSALAELGGEATTKQIAEKVNLNVNGVSQSLGAMFKHVECLCGRGGKTK
jgi:DNA-binding NarL/FixJ family response regulator